MSSKRRELQRHLPTILLIDDDDATRYGRSRALTEAGYRVLEAATVDEGRLMLTSLDPQGVVLGAMLPARVGLEFCRKMKEDPDTTAVPLLHVSVNAAERMTGLDAGADICLAEPLAPGELTATVRALLRLSQRASEARRLAGRLSRLERQFAEATEAADCGMWDWDVRSGRLEWFGKVEGLPGLRSGTYSGTIEGLSDILPPDDRTRVWRKLEDLMARRETHFEDEHRLVHPDGTVHWMSAIGRFFYDDQGQAVRMTGVVQDVTTRKLAEQRQQLESERRRLLACSAEQLLVAENPAGLLAGVFETVRNHLQVDGYIHYRVDECRSVLVLAAWAGFPEDRRSELGQLDFGQALCGMTAQRRTLVIRERLHESHDEKAQLAKGLGFRAYACHPLLVGDRLLGTLSFASKTRDRFAADEIALMESICRYVAAAMDRLRLKAETQERTEHMRRSEEHLRAAMELNPQIPWTAGPDGLIEDFNERWLHLTGFTREEALGDSWMRVMHEEDVPRMVEAWTRSLQTGKPYDVEHRVRTASGGDRWMRSRAFPHRDGAGIIVRWYGTTEDVHDRKQAEEALHESENRYRFLANTMPQIVFTATSEGQVDYVNEPGLRWMGVTIEQACGLGWTALIHEDDRQLAVERWAACAPRGEPYEYETRLRRADGEYRWQLARALPIRNDSGMIVQWIGTSTDIHDHKQAEAALRNSEERFRTMAQAVPSFLFETDADGWNTWTSEGWCRFTGQTQEEVRGHGWAEALHPDDRAANLDQWIQCMRDGVPFVSRQRVRRVDGQYAWVVAKALPMRDEQGRVYRWLGSVTDVDDIVRSEAVLRESEERFRTLADHSPDPIWVTSPDGVEFMNAAYRAFFGVGPAEVRGGQWERLLHPDDAQGYIGAYRKASQEHGPFHAHARVRRADGAWRWVDSRGVVRWSAAGEFLGHVGTSRDITEMKLAEEALRRQQEQLRVITDAMPGFIAYVDQEERYRFVNAEYEKWLHRPRQEILGRSVKDLLGKGYSAVEPFIARVLQGEAVRFEQEVQYGDAEHTVLASYTPDIREGGAVAGFYVLVTNITERKRHEEELRRWKDELEVRVAERTRELVASQDRLRALASQLSVTEQRERRKLAQDLHDYLAQLLVVGRMKLGQAKKHGALSPAVEAAVEDVDHIFQQALRYTRTMIAELSPPSLQEAGLPAALEWLGERMQKDGLWVEVHADREQLPLAEDRAVCLFQSVRELLFNVLKHAGVDRATVTLTGQPSGEVRLTVEDRGRGADAEAMQRAAEPGHLGLFSVRERMEAMGGRVEFLSTPGQGTTVTLFLPAKRLP